MLHARRVNPATTVEGLFEVAFNLGLSFIGNEDILARLIQGREDDVIVWGVQRQDVKSAGGTVHLDGASVVKTKLKWGRKGQVRGV